MLDLGKLRIRNSLFDFLIDLGCLPAIGPTYLTLSHSFISTPLHNLQFSPPTIHESLIFSRTLSPSTATSLYRPRSTSEAHTCFSLVPLLGPLEPPCPWLDRPLGELVDKFSNLSSTRLSFTLLQQRPQGRVPVASLLAARAEKLPCSCIFLLPEHQRPNSLPKRKRITHRSSYSIISTQRLA